MMFLAVFLIGAAHSQSDKKFRFGLQIDPSINWFSPENTKKYENLGSGIGFTWGFVQKSN